MLEFIIFSNLHFKGYRQCDTSSFDLLHGRKQIQTWNRVLLVWWRFQSDPFIRKEQVEKEEVLEEDC